MVTLRTDRRLRSPSACTSMLRSTGFGRKAPGRRTRVSRQVVHRCDRAWREPGRWLGWTAVVPGDPEHDRRDDRHLRDGRCDRWARRGAASSPSRTTCSGTPLRLCRKVTSDRSCLRSACWRRGRRSPAFEQEFAAQLVDGPHLRRRQLRHLRPAPRPARRRRRPRRRGHRPVVHLRGDRQLGRADRRDAGLRRHRAGHFCLDPAAVEAGRHRRTRSAIMPVHLYGHPADMDRRLGAVAERARPADLRGRRAGARRHAGTAARSAPSARSRCSASTRPRT